MSKDKNTELFEQLRHCEATGNESQAIRIRQEIVEANIGLIHWQERKYYWNEKDGCIEGSDLVAAGVIGMYKAIDRFDLQKGFTFSTYARFWVRSYMDREILKVNTVRGPGKTWLPKGSIQSLDEPVTGHVDRYDVIQGNVEQPDTELIQKEQQELYNKTFDIVGYQLGEKMKKAAIGIFKEERIYEDIGEEIGVTKQRVQQIRVVYVNKLTEQLQRHV